MAANGATVAEDADMADCDGQKVVTMMDVLQEQQDFEDDANAVLGASDDKNCTYSRGYVRRQALYACLTCCPDAKNDKTKRAGVCLACSLHCHENHELIELYTKRNFRCDCGNPKFNSHPCTFTPNKSDLNYENKYNQNFSGVYCTCHRPYPDPEATHEEEMIQCIVCEDWLHANHLEATVPDNDQYSEMICQDCMEDNDFLHDYTDIVINTADKEIVITDPDLDVTDYEPVLNGGLKVTANAINIIETGNDPKMEESTSVTDAEKGKTENGAELKNNKTEEATRNGDDIEMADSKPDEKEGKDADTEASNQEQIQPEPTEIKDATEESKTKIESNGVNELDEATKEKMEEDKLLEDEEDLTKTEPQVNDNTIEKTNDTEQDKNDIQTTKESLEKTDTDKTQTSPNKEPVSTTCVEKEDIQTNGDKEKESNSDNKDPEQTTLESQDNKRKLTNKETEESTSSKKPKLENECKKPKGVKRLYKGATFWPDNFRQKLCTCSECISMYKDLAVLFLIDPEDTVTAYEALGKDQMDPASQYEKGLAALSSLDRIQQINALTEYNKMRDKLLDFLKSFKERKEIVKEEDIKAFFAGMKPKRESDGSVYFCR